MHAAKARKRLTAPPPDYPAEPPAVYATLTIHFPHSGENLAVELLRAPHARRDQFLVRVDGCRPELSNCTDLGRRLGRWLPRYGRYGD